MSWVITPYQYIRVDTGLYERNSGQGMNNRQLFSSSIMFRLERSTRGLDKCLRYIASTRASTRAVLRYIVCVCGLLVEMSRRGFLFKTLTVPAGDWL